MSLPNVSRRAEAALTRNTIESLRANALALPPLEDAEAFGRAFDSYGGAKIVLLGEASHGSSEFYRARATITRRLIERHGFNIVAVEADFPDAARIDRHVRHHAAEPGEGEAFARFPAWMWRNTDVHGFIEWLRAHNERLAAEARTEFRGLDVYSLGASIEAVLAYLDRVDPVEARSARARYGCLTPWQAEPALYGRMATRGGETCENEAVAQLEALLGKRLDYARRDGEAFFDAAQNARIVLAAEQYYRVMYRGSRESWNLRDRHMFDTLQALLKRRPGAKAVVWAHNSHIGNAAATSMGWEGEFNIGELCRKAYGDEALAIGFGTDRGTVAAASEWDGEMEIKTVLPARADSYEHLFLQTGVAASLTDWRGREGLREALSFPRLERAIGVIYRPDTEYLSHYFRAVLADQFDAFVWFEVTNAVTPLPASRPHGAADTYPFGL
jgi:erythromycin esterase-like protein